MTKRMLVMLAIVAVFLAAIGTVKYRQVKAGMAAGASFQPAPEAVTTIVAERADWPATIQGIGTVTPVQGVLVSADLPGIVARIAFGFASPALTFAMPCATPSEAPIEMMLSMAFQGSPQPSV